ncbi:GTP cyclohydrolase II [Bradymonadaceae bacterium TMQ3]|uniref:GTP cyclohydrolase-2 n=1 Tax=Lujinxingia sediminis TaxID=2480984 RepID=A0ABY0CRW4_9DELT|nr:GTP cyclohydrolase II [Lujinxingia sediminis]RDV38310.1 GTP cyclohydrolase II [Bradymonadaceae bacterium TMQ3]RVU43487.1 GTP cyclohydrolase II [Lujinxingia sediminis]TXC75984.1 GTP cyclohydrolase II [Bradymonadales bacterium TMQ1]
MSIKLKSAANFVQPPNPSANDPLNVHVEHFATAELPTRYGKFRIVAFKNDIDGKDHVAVVHGDVAGKRGVLTRIHSECLTGDVFGSLKCDCGPQLNAALEEIAEQDAGIILYMRQEGRGIGLANKIKAYSLQDQGMDTVEANEHLGFDDDLRDYSISAKMLELLGVESIVLMTNNPSKVDGLEEAGIVIDERRPIKTIPNPHNYNYLETKRTKSGHLL